MFINSTSDIGEKSMLYKLEVSLRPLQNGSTHALTATHIWFTRNAIK